MNRFITLLLVAIAGASARPSHRAPLFTAQAEDAVQGSYIVKMKDVSTQGLNAHHSWLLSKIEESEDSEITHFYEMDSFKGYSGKFDDETLSAIRSSPDVEFVEQDQLMYAISTQTGATWGLDRIDQHTLPLDGLYSYPDNAGEGVDVYVVDTGVNIDHQDFEGRAVWGKTTASRASDTDKNGHGTHVAGTIAGKTYGVAKNAKIYAVKVLGDNGSGTNADVIAGVNWVASAHKAKAGAKSVANMSLGGGKSSTLDSAVNSAVKAGVIFAVAAGNDNADACKYSPAASTEAITVGASTSTDTLASFSNKGKCVDIVAPGQGITSTWIGSTTATNTISGTSMASPHVAGAAAVALSNNIPTENVKQYLVDTASDSQIKSIPTGTPNKLLFVA